MAAAIRLFRLGHQSLWIDEIFTWLAAGGGAHFSMRDVLENVHGPLPTLAVRACMLAFGEHEWALRLPSAIAGILTVPAMAWLAHRWLGRDTVIAAAWLTAGSPFLAWYSQEARNYAWLILGACAATALLLELRHRCDAGGAARYLAAAAFGVLSNLSFALLVPLHLKLGLTGAPATLGARRRLLLAVAVVLALLASPWLPQIARTWDWRRLAPERSAVAGETPLRGSSTMHVAAVPFALHAFCVGYSLGPSLREMRAHAGAATIRRHAAELAATAAVFGTLALLGLVALRRRGRLADTLLWLVAPAGIVSYFAAQNFKVFHPRYMAVALPCWLLLLAAGHAQAGPRARRGLTVAVAGLWALSLWNMAFSPGYGREDYRGAMAFVRANWRAGDRVLAVGADEPVLFYGRGLDVRRFWLGHVGRPDHGAAKLEEAMAGSGGTFVVLSRPEDLDPAGVFARGLDTTYPDAKRFTGAGVRAWELPPAATAAPGE